MHTTPPLKSVGNAEAKFSLHAKVPELDKQVGLPWTRREIKSGIVRIETRELECERGVSHHAIETIFRDEADCRKAVAELAWILAYRRGMLLSQHRFGCLDLRRL